MQLVRNCGRNLRIVVVDCFYDILSDEPVKKLFADIADFKIRSYLKEYPYGILPFSGHDLVGTHFLLCEEKEEKLIPLMGYKAVTTEQCKTFHLGFPALDIVNDNNAHLQRDALLYEIAQAEKRGHAMGYLGSWTIAPEIRSTKVLSKICRDVSAALLGWWSVHYDIRSAIALASLKFHIDKFHRELGFLPLTYQGQSLPNFTMRGHFDDLVNISIFHKERMSKAVQDLMVLYGELWDQRIHYGKAKDSDEKKAA